MLADWLKAERTARGLTQKEIGAAMGLDEGTTSKVFRGHRSVSGDELVAAMIMFGYPTPWDRDRGTELQKLVRAASALSAEQKRALAQFLRALAG